MWSSRSPPSPLNLVLRLRLPLQILEDAMLFLYPFLSSLNSKKPSVLVLLGWNLHFKPQGLWDQGRLYDLFSKCFSLTILLSLDIVRWILFFLFLSIYKVFGCMLLFF
uniref:Putative 40S ribosomal protein S20-2-like n=1 Tax=Davidia involucrata TaxID=16924 RepID=A0A5B7AI78_DAVIN